MGRRTPSSAGPQYRQVDFRIQNYAVEAADAGPLGQVLLVHRKDRFYHVRGEFGTHRQTHRDFTDNSEIVLRYDPDPCRAETSWS